MEQEQVNRLIEALRLTTSALRRAKTPGAENRVEESERLMRELGIEPIPEPPPTMNYGSRGPHK
jgi:hypothetical protein